MTQLENVKKYNKELESKIEKLQSFIKEQQSEERIREEENTRIKVLIPSNFFPLFNYFFCILVRVIRGDKTIEGQTRSVKTVISNPDVAASWSKRKGNQRHDRKI